MSATKAGKRPLRSLTAHEKLNAIRRVHEGESKASVARDIGVPESTLRGWCKNEEKISYLTRQSSPETDDSNDNPTNPIKKIKLEEQPYNLSLKTCGSSNGTYSPNSENHYGLDYTKNNETESDNSPLNLRTKPDTTSAPVSTPKSAINSASSEREKEREKNRAELARLSAELGLNRPEVFLSSLNNSNNMNEITGLLIQWNSIYQQHLMYQQQKAVPPKNKVTSPADTSTKVPSPKGLLTTVDHRDKLLPNTEQPSVYDSVSYWLRQQSLMGFSPASTQHSLINLSSCLPSTSSMTPITTSTAANSTSALLNSLGTNQTVNQQLRFWNWYKQSAAQSVYNQTQVQTTEKPILYQQLTKEGKDKDYQNTENIVVKEEKPKIVSKSRSVLDNLLLNNNTMGYDVIHKEDAESGAYEALEHGEKFLKWLESCSDPSVTTVQILALQTLIKNLKSGFDRKNGDLQGKTKVKRK